MRTLECVFDVPHLGEKFIIFLTECCCILTVFFRELSSTFIKLCDLVDAARKKVENEISKLSDEIADLEKTENEARLLGLVDFLLARFGRSISCFFSLHLVVTPFHVFRNKARWLEEQLSNFIREFGLSRSKI